MPTSSTEGISTGDKELEDAFARAVALDRTRDHAGAARLLDEVLARTRGAPAPRRFAALVLRADLAVSLNELIEARGILAEARQIMLTPAEREGMAADLRRADDLEVFLTHRGCAG